MKPGPLKIFLANCKQWLRRLIEVLARCPSGAYLLSLLYFCVSTWKTGKPVKVFWDGRGWYRIENKVWIALGPVSPLGTGIARLGLSNGEEIFGPRRKWWFRYYQPVMGDKILDIGAGMGEDAWVFSRAVGERGRILAVEAHPTTYQILRDFIHYNRLPNVDPYFGAACNHPGRAIITDRPMSDWQLNSLSFGQNTSMTAGHGVPAFRLDDLEPVIGFPRIAFIKMNIEGAEALALEGAQHTLSKTQHICVCCHDFLGPATATKAEVCRILRASGFHLFFTEATSPPYERDFVYGKRVSN